VKADRGATLAALVTQRDELQAEAKAENKARREEIAKLAQRISALAHDVTSGQATLYEETEE
jgi:hypothetical protein